MKTDSVRRTAYSDDDDSPTSDTGSSDDHPALTVLESYYEAAQSDDPDAIREYLHSAHPYNRDESERATVSLDGAGEVAAKELRVYAESVGDYSRYWQKDGETLPSVTAATTPFDPGGDEIVVTLLLEADEQVVIHREQYDPGN